MEDYLSTKTVTSLRAGLFYFSIFAILVFMNSHGPDQGHLHPLSQIITKVVSVFHELGFKVATGPEQETSFYNFDALNIPADHPARDMQDTFWLKSEQGDKLLRTHTSPVQIRYMEKHKSDLPVRIVVPGKVFRNEATDATHEAQFFQMEGLLIDKEVSVAHLKGTLEFFLKRLYGENTKLRLRPSFFAFVEPGFEVDISCFKCAGVGCPLCKKTGWIEVMGAGLVHSNVLTAVGIDPNEWQGFAFGTGIDRLMMMKYGVDDARLSYTGDLRFVKQF